MTKVICSANGYSHEDDNEADKEFFVFHFFKVNENKYKSCYYSMGGRLVKCVVFKGKSGRGQGLLDCFLLRWRADFCRVAAENNLSHK